MATITPVENFPRKTLRNKYHWAKYAGGQIWKFGCKDTKEVQTIYYSSRMWAIKNYYDIRTQRERLTIYIQFEKRTETPHDTTPAEV